MRSVLNMAFVAFQVNHNIAPIIERERRYRNVVYRPAIIIPEKILILERDMATATGLVIKGNRKSDYKSPLTIVINSYIKKQNNYILLIRIIRGYNFIV
jgi:hypothetical protein